VTVTEPPGAGDSLEAGTVSSPVLLPDHAQSGLTEATVRDFDALYAEYFPFVWRCLRGLGVPDAGLDDAAQDVFVVVHRQLPAFRANSTVRTWLYGIVRNVASNQRRGRARKGQAEPLDERLPSQAQDPAERAQDAQAAAFVQRFVAKLDAKKRDVFLLVVLEEMSIPEVAAALSIPLNTAYSRLRLVRADFQAALAKEAPR
jgi:RNA polymerase sigma-70 factor, ECF subfamily